MPEARLSVRVDEDIKRRAESIFRDLGLTMSAGINLYLSQVALQEGIPFLLRKVPQKKQLDTDMHKQIEELKAQIAVYSKLKSMLERGIPVALYDDLLQRPYIEYPDGQKVYEIQRGTTMTELELKYGCNPNQKPSRIFMDKGDLPVEVLNGKPGYINFLDALNSYQLVKELKEATGLPSAASFKHVSPAGAAVGLPLSDIETRMFFAENLPPSPLACAYIRARGADRVSSYGDWAALSDICDEETAAVLAPEVSDGVIAPGYTEKALSILKTKRNGAYNIVKIDPGYIPRPEERKDVFGVTFEQGRNELKIDPEMLKNIVTKNKDLPESAQRDLLIALITLKYTQSNSVCYVSGGQAIGIGAGQQSRIHCTRLAGTKADNWRLRQHPKVLELPFITDIGRPQRDNAIDLYISDDCNDVLSDGAWQQLFTEKPATFSLEERLEWIAGTSDAALGSDAFFPFGDNIERAKKSGVKYIAQPGGSIRDDDVIKTCDKYDIIMAFTGIRLFHH